jgi:predicted transcriptional regulator of viral defense system
VRPAGCGVRGADVVQGAALAARIPTRRRHDDRSSNAYPNQAAPDRHFGPLIELGQGNAKCVILSFMPGRNFNALYEVAEDNYGFLTVDDARGLGIRPQRLAEMARRGSLRREGLGLYRLEPFPTHELDGYRKATLWPYGIEGVLSHETALDLCGLSDVNPARIDITVPRRYRLRRREAPRSYRFHHEDLDRRDVTLHEGLPIVTAAKAIRQCHAESLRRDLLRQALEDAKQQGLVTRTVYGELMHELQFDAANIPTR